jgi:thiosulfate dehydrogenase
MRGLLVLLAAGCVIDTPAAEKGRALFEDPAGLSASTLNQISCATCHDTEEGATSKKTGSTLFGVTARTSFWGGQEPRLLDAVNACLTLFLRGDPLDETSEKSRQLWEFLASITPDDAPGDPVPVTIPESITPLPLGDATRGARLFADACEPCHGAPHTGEGNLIEPDEIVLPEATAEYAEVFPGVMPGLVVIEKVRHGRFFGIGGVMAPFSIERLSDAELSDLLAFLGTPAE